MLKSWQATEPKAEMTIMCSLLGHVAFNDAEIIILFLEIMLWFSYSSVGRAAKGQKWNCWNLPISACESERMLERVQRESRPFGLLCDLYVWEASCLSTDKQQNVRRSFLKWFKGFVNQGLENLFGKSCVCVCVRVTGMFVTIIFFLKMFRLVNQILGGAAFSVHV